MNNIPTIIKSVTPVLNNIGTILGDKISDLIDVLIPTDNSSNNQDI